MCSAHAASKCGVLSMAHALDEVAGSCVGLAKEAKDKRMDTTQRADAGDEGSELTLYGMGKIRVELGEVGFNLSEDGSSAAVHSASGIRAGGRGIVPCVVADSIQRLELEEVVGGFRGVSGGYAYEEVGHISAAIVEKVRQKVNK